MDGLAKSERPSQRNKTRIVVLDATAIEKLVAAKLVEDDKPKE